MSPRVTGCIPNRSGRSIVAGRGTGAQATPDGSCRPALGDRDYLEGRFTAGDLMMTAVLRILRHTDLVADEPKLKAYQHRCQARPAFQRALRDQRTALETR